jgi:hypothetical protein
MSYVSGCEGVVMLLKSVLNIYVTCLFSIPFNTKNVFIAPSFFFGIQRKIHALSNAVCGS